MTESSSNNRARGSRGIILCNLSLSYILYLLLCRTRRSKIIPVPVPVAGNVLCREVRCCSTYYVHTILWLSLFSPCIEEWLSLFAPCIEEVAVQVTKNFINEIAAEINSRLDLLMISTLFCCSGLYARRPYYIQVNIKYWANHDAVLSYILLLRIRCSSTTYHMMQVYYRIYEYVPSTPVRCTEQRINVYTPRSQVRSYRYRNWAVGCEKIPWKIRKFIY